MQMQNANAMRKRCNAMQWVLTKSANEMQNPKKVFALPSLFLTFPSNLFAQSSLRKHMKPRLLNNYRLNNILVIQNGSSTHLLKLHSSWARFCTWPNVGCLVIWTTPLTPSMKLEDAEPASAEEEDELPCPLVEDEPPTSSEFGPDESPARSSSGPSSSS